MSLPEKALVSKHRPEPPARSSNKRRRVVYSCENCRFKKLRCDRERPICSTCVKQNQVCEYSTPFASVTGIAPNTSSKSLEAQIRTLKDRLYALEQAREEILEACPGEAGELTSPNSSKGINFTHIMSFPNLITMNKYLSSFSRLVAMNNKREMFGSSSIPEIIDEQFEKEKRDVSDIELIKHNLRGTKSTLGQLIKDYLKDVLQLWELVNHFFTSELFMSYAYIDRNTFHVDLKEFLVRINEDGPVFKSDYPLAGVLLLILRIAYISFYNCGYSHPPINVITPDAFSIAALCFEESAMIHRITENSHLLELMFLISSYQKICPESLGPVPSKQRVTVHQLFHFMLGMGLNRDTGNDDVDSNYRRRLWHHLLEFERIEFIYFGAPAQIDTEKYTTMIPQISSSLSKEDNFFNEMYQDRQCIHELATKLSNMIFNVRTLSTLDAYDQMLDEIRKRNIGLKAVLAMDSTNVQNRMRKTLNFMSYLDLSSMEYMLSIHMLLHYDSIGATQTTEFQNLLKSLVHNVSEIITLSYFLDHEQQHFYNLREHFGCQVQLIPRIIQSLHRCLQFQQTILIKLCYQTEKQKSESVIMMQTIDKIKTSIFQNTKVLVSACGGISDRYLYAKRLHIALSFIILRMFGTQSKLSSDCIEWLATDKTIRPLSPESCWIISDELVVLTGQRQLLQNTYKKDPETNYFGEVFGNFTSELVGLDTTLIEELESFLSTQSFN